MSHRHRKSSSSAVFLLIIFVLLGIIGFLLWSKSPSSARTAPVSSAKAHVAAKGPPASAATPAASSTEPLSASVTVSTPVSGAAVGQTFDVAGVAPNGWYFEAVFPIQVRDPDDDLVATGQGRAQSDWTVAGPVKFKATIALSTPYAGPADLILLRDNPSGLPENSDEVTIPITIK